MFNKIKEKIRKIHYNINNNLKLQRLILAGFCISLLVFSYFLLNYKDLVAVYNLEKKVSSKVENMTVSLGGEAVGIKLLATGVLVMGLDRQDTNLEIGDIILSVNGTRIESNSELVAITKLAKENSMNIEVSRHGEKFNTNITPIYDEISNDYRLGLWVKDSSAGVGTITFYDLKTSKFASLGHAVTETKENYVLPITAGGITSTTIYSIKKGIAKAPGELKGSITSDTLGQIIGNTNKGVYGKITNNKLLEDKKEIDILPKTKIEEGKASIFCTLDDNQINEYEIQIEKVLLTSTGNKNMIIKVTDEKLLNKTGGIIQGMSGSPIVQKGKLVGAVTHVFLNDPARGYGVFIENMIEDMSGME